MNEAAAVLNGNHDFEKFMDIGIDKLHDVKDKALSAISGKPVQTSKHLPRPGYGRKRSHSAPHGRRDSYYSDSDSDSDGRDSRYRRDRRGSQYGNSQRYGSPQYANSTYTGSRRWDSHDDRSTYTGGGRAQSARYSSDSESDYDDDEDKGHGHALSRRKSMKEALQHHRNDRKLFSVLPTAVGAIAGGIAGNKVGHHNTAAMVGGAVIGALGANTIYDSRKARNLVRDRGSGRHDNGRD